jgi:hypothetical protein
MLQEKQICPIALNGIPFVPFSIVIMLIFVYTDCDSSFFVDLFYMYMANLGTVFLFTALVFLVLIHDFSLKEFILVLGQDHVWMECVDVYKFY